jgi:hypothetical protein
MERGITLRAVFSYLEDAERLGIFVRCPLHRRPSEIFDCVTCAHYRGLETGDRQVFRLRCTEPDPAARRPDGGTTRAAAPLHSAS